MQKGELDGPALGACRPICSSTKRVLHDIVGAYYAHPTAWSEIGWAGPASPRGFVRMDKNRARPVGGRRGESGRRG